MSRDYFIGLLMVIAGAILVAFPSSDTFALLCITAGALMIAEQVVLIVIKVNARRGRKVSE